MLVQFYQFPMRNELSRDFLLFNRSFCAFFVDFRFKTGFTVLNAMLSLDNKVARYLSFWMANRQHTN